jgi:hypothetical protein
MHHIRAAILAAVKRRNLMPASQRTKRLPPNFGAIDPNAPFDVQRFFTALGATGITPNVLYNIDEDKVTLVMERGDQKTKLQRERLQNVYAWAANKDPEGKLQWKFVTDWVRSLRFADRSAGSGPRYFEYPLDNL